jgi:hypothetical protein
LTVQAIDARSFESWLTTGGGIDAISRATNRRAVVYSGSGNG